MLLIGPLLNNNAPFQVSFFCLAKPKFLGNLCLLLREYNPYPDFFFSLLMAKKAQVSQFFKS